MQPIPGFKIEKPFPPAAIDYGQNRDRYTAVGNVLVPNEPFEFTATELASQHVIQLTIDPGTNERPAGVIQLSILIPEDAPTPYITGRALKHLPVIALMEQAIADRSVTAIAHGGAVILAGGSKKKISKQRSDEDLKELYLKGIPIADIAAITNQGKSTIERKLRKLRADEALPKRNDKLTDEHLERIAKQVAAGSTARDIARKHEVDLSTATRWIQRAPTQPEAKANKDVD